ncbi:MAG: DUF4837 family protein [Alistipes sp.]|nr:DUF4837 family protein [Alistipes sp.]
MKNFLKSISALICMLLIATGCDSFNSLSRNNKATQGSPYELLVVCNNTEWEGKVGEALRSLLEQPVPMLNQNEPMFNVLRITAGDFKNLLVQHRNILKVVVSQKATRAAIVAQYDVEAAPQIVLTLQGPTQESMLEYLAENGEALLQVLEMAERDRTVRYAEKYANHTLSKIIKEVVGVDFRVPKGYVLRAQSENFVWASHEYPTASQGFFIYSYPYKSKGSLSVEYLVAMRNKFAKRIPGPSDGSYMITVEEIPDADGVHSTPLMPEYRVLEIEGRKWIELRGFWDVENDFMGGPFVSYTTIDAASGNIVTLDCYVHSPKYGKRNFLRPLEHLVHLIKIPATQSAE